MVQPTAIFIKMAELEMVLSLLSQHVDPASIPEYVRRTCSGLALTVNDIEAIKVGMFHISESDLPVRMMSSGNLIVSDLVDDFFLLLPTISSLQGMKDQLEKDYGFVIDDIDLLDLSKGAFHVAGRQCIDNTTKDKIFMSEAVWLFEKGCPSQFVSQYVQYRFRSHLPAQELIGLALKPDDDMAEDVMLNAVVKSAYSSPPLASPCLKQTSRRAPPPPPILTFSALPMPGVYAEQLFGGTYTANSAVFCHRDNGTYSMMADLVGSPNSNDDFPSSTCSSNIDNFSLDVNLSSAYMDIDAEGNSDIGTDEDLILLELGTETLPELHDTGEEIATLPDIDIDNDLQLLSCTHESQLLFDQELEATYDDREVDPDKDDHLPNGNLNDADSLRPSPWCTGAFCLSGCGRHVQ